MFRDELTEILMQFQTLEGLVEAAMITRSTMLITSRSVVVSFISTTPPDKTASFTKLRDNSFMNDESCHLQTLTSAFFVNSRDYLNNAVDA